MHVCIAQCAQCLLHIISTSLGLIPCVLMRVHMHQVLDAHVLAITHLATSTSDMNEHKTHVPPNNYSLDGMYIVANTRLVLRCMPLPSPLNNRLKYYLRRVPIYFQTIYTCAVDTRLVPQHMPLPSPFHFTTTIKLSAHLNTYSFPFQLHTWPSLLIPPNP